MNLTERQAEVLTLVSTGHTDPQIAKRIGISRYTVNEHMRNIYATLNVTTRAHAVAVAMRKGIIR